MVESNRGISRRAWSWGEPSAIKPHAAKPSHSTHWPAFGRPASLFDAHSALHSPLVSWSDTTEPSTSNDQFALDIILKEIDNEFRHIKGEPVYTFGRQPTPGLEDVRNAISKHAKALVDKISVLEAQLDTEENRRALAKKKIREAISDGRKEALECRIKTIENILVEYLPVA